MYKLLKPVIEGLNLMLKEFEKYIADTGLAKVKAFYSENVSFIHSVWFLFFIFHRIESFLAFINKPLLDPP